MTEPQQPDLSDPQPPPALTSWRTLWRNLLIDEDTGLLDHDALMDTLHDYRILRVAAAIVYAKVTDGLVLATQTPADEVLHAFERRRRDYLARHLRRFVQAMIDSGRRPQVETLHELLVFAASVDADPAEDTYLEQEMRRAVAAYDARRAKADQTASGSAGRSNRAG
jgi:hypothetical protein